MAAAGRLRPLRHPLGDRLFAADGAGGAAAPPRAPPPGPAPAAGADGGAEGGLEDLRTCWIDADERGA
eukprot:3374754-Pyramimonas_sp.AAC.1